MSQMKVKAIFSFVLPLMAALCATARRSSAMDGLQLQDSTIEKQINVSYFSIRNPFKKRNNNVKPLPIKTFFKLPNPLPSWPQGRGFASGIIDLGGLQVSQVSTFSQVWATHEGGPDNLGATFFEPSSIPNGFSLLGFYSQSNNRPLSGHVLVAKDANNQGILKQPLDYTLIWSSESLKIKQDGVGYIWLPIPPDGYKAVGHVITTSPQKPAVDKIRCVRLDFTGSGENDDFIWGLLSGNNINVYTTRPSVRGVEAMGVPTGTFLVQTNGNVGSNLTCLKNAKANQTSLPNQDQINALMKAYSPLVYFHPDEDYFPSSVMWFFENGALLYTKGQESNPITINTTGSNLPQGGGNDGAYWIDLPINDKDKERVKIGNLQDACSYIHVKTMFGGTFTDIAVWLFYPFNGPSRAKVEFLNIKLGKLGEHVGDWEHVTLRISNFNGELKGVYFSQHNKGQWVDASQLELKNGTNKPVVYSSLHGHAAYPRPGLVVLGGDNVGIRDDSDKGNFMDSGEKFVVVYVDYVKGVFEEPLWLNYAREWGPKLSYDIDEEIKKVEKVMIGQLKKKFERFVESVPNEVLGEEGPTGPKGKDNWLGDERF